MTHLEANAIRTYYESISYAQQNDIQLLYHSSDTVTYFVKYFNHKEFENYQKLYKGVMSDEKIKVYAKIIDDYLGLLDDIFTDKVAI